MTQIISEQVDAFLAGKLKAVALPQFEDEKSRKWTYGIVFNNAVENVDSSKPVLQTKEELETFMGTHNCINAPTILTCLRYTLTK